MIDKEKITVIKSKRKTYSIEINRDGNIVLRVPLYTTQKKIDLILKEKEQWILKTKQKVCEYNNSQKTVKPFDKAEIEKLKNDAKIYIPQRVDFFADIMNLSYGKITIRLQKTRWGSCSSKGNLNFNCLLMMMPKEVIDYVVVHELCHLKEMNHSKNFWKCVEDVLPDYKERRKYLKSKGSNLIAKIK